MLKSVEFVVTVNYKVFRGRKMNDLNVIDEVEGLYKIISLKVFRKTQGVIFDMVPKWIVENTKAIDRVIHEKSAQSPGSVEEVERPWYMHPHQADNLIVLSGERHVDLYNVKHGQIEKFDVTKDYVKKNGELITEDGGMLIWPTYVFHRIVSGENGSASINFAIHYEGFDITTNFSIYDLNIDTGEYHVIREGFKDQF